MSCCKNIPMDKICRTCGNVGYAKDLATCHHCDKTFEHIYCMQKQRDVVPRQWYCEECVVGTTALGPAKKVKRSSILLETLPGVKATIPLRGRQRYYNRASKQSNGNTEQSRGIRDLRNRNCYSSRISNMRSQRVSTEGPSGTTATQPLSWSPKGTYTRTAQRNPVGSAGIQQNLSKPTEESDSIKKEKTTQNDKASEKASDVPCKDVPRNNTAPAATNYTTAASVHNDEERKGAERAPAATNYTTAASVHNNEERKGIKRASGSTSGSNTPDMNHRAHNQKTANLSPEGISSNTMHSDAQLNKPRRQNIGLSPPTLVVSNAKLPHQPIPDTIWKGSFEIFDAVSYVYQGIQGIQAHLPGIGSLNVYDMFQKLPSNIQMKLLSVKDVLPKLFRLDLPTVEDIGSFFFPLDEQRSKETYMCFVEIMDKRDLAMQSWIGDVELLIFTSTKLHLGSAGLIQEKFMWGVFRHLRQKKQISHNMVEVTPSARENPPHAPGFSRHPSRNQANSKRLSANSVPVNDNNQAGDTPPGFTKPCHPPK